MNLEEIKIKMIDAANCANAKVDEEYLQKMCSNYRATQVGQNNTVLNLSYPCACLTLAPCYSHWSAA